MKEETKLMLYMAPIWAVNFVGDKVYAAKKKAERNGRKLKKKIRNSVLYR